jgi:hypothetical protein
VIAVDLVEAAPSAEQGLQAIVELAKEPDPSLNPQPCLTPGRGGAGQARIAARWLHRGRPRRPVDTLLQDLDRV